MPVIIGASTPENPTSTIVISTLMCGVDFDKIEAKDGGEMAMYEMMMDASRIFAGQCITTAVNELGLDNEINFMGPSFYGYNDVDMLKEHSANMSKTIVHMQGLSKIPVFGLEIICSSPRMAFLFCKSNGKTGKKGKKGRKGRIGGNLLPALAFRIIKADDEKVLSQAAMGTALLDFEEDTKRFKENMAAHPPTAAQANTAVNEVRVSLSDMPVP
tara:strand:+ start:297 stop:941 length:645 start_codon:yes stop_codon:yes gene_type:complete